MKKQFLEIGKFVATQGIRGELRVQYYCDSPDIICDFESLYLDKGNAEIEISRSYPHKNVVIMKLDGVDTVEAAQKYIGKMIYMDRDDLELDDDTFYIQDLIGMTVVDVDSGKEYGKLSEIYQNGGTDVYSIKTEGGSELMFPAIPEVLIDVDTENGIMKIRPLKGLFEDEEIVR